MESGLHSILQDPGIEAPAQSNIPGHVNYNLLNSEAFTQSNSHPLPGVFAPGIRAPAEILLNQQNAYFTGSNLTAPIPTNQSSTYLPHPAGNNENFVNFLNVFSGPVNTISAELNQIADLERQWTGYSQGGNTLTTDYPMPSSTAQAAYYPQGSVQATSTGPIQGPPGTQLQSVVHQTYPGIHQLPSLNPISPNAPIAVGAQPAVGPPPPHSGSHLRQNRHSTQYPQSGVSAAASQQRRHNRTQSLASTGLSPPVHQHNRTGTQSARGRNRPVQSANTLPSRQYSSSVAQANQPSTTSSLNTRSTTRAPEHIPITPHQQLLQSVRLGDLLRSMTDGAQALQMYEGSLRQGSRYPPEADTSSSSPSPKIKPLDAPSESRPEPKETDELTVNLECKICMSQVVDTVILPCGHAILCRWCADQHIPSRRGHPKGHATCPMCRAPVKKKVP